MSWAIQVEKLAKKYRRGGAVAPSANFRETLTHMAKETVIRLNPVRQMKAVRHKTAQESVEFWALKDINLEVREGEILGVIGHNGAGKSTLLKIMSRITPPTRGTVRYRGRVAALLEVGTGFHRELTGRENVFLNGSILGMRRQEIARKLDAIVAFAEVEKFLDTPVKFYSSGMYLRLAFSVAAHLESDILLVDEVLAVGDASFQKKCLGRMEEVASQGRTVLFVSHNLPAILGLCGRAILLDHGSVEAEGQARSVIDKYLQTVYAHTSQSLEAREMRSGTQALQFLSYQLKDAKGKPLRCAHSGQDVVLALKFKAKSGGVKNVHVAVGVHGKFDENLFHLSTGVKGGDFNKVPESGEFLCEIPCLPLQPGRYSFNLFCTVGGEIADWIQGAGTIDVEAGDFFGSGKIPPADQGAFMVRHGWSVSPDAS